MKTNPFNEQSNIPETLQQTVCCLAWQPVATQGLAWHQACHARPLHGSQAQMLMLLELLLELLLLLLLYVFIT